MGRVPSPEDALFGSLECDDAGSGAPSAEATDQFLQLRGASHHSTAIHDRFDQEPSSEPAALRGRSDIDLAMVEALQHAMDPDYALRSTPWVGSRALSSRCDIDTAMVEALRRAMDGDPPPSYA
jgi:hypothetical protein